jgi:hypothetical protein
VYAEGITTRTRFAAKESKNQYDRWKTWSVNLTPISSYRSTTDDLLSGLVFLSNQKTENKNKRTH